MTGLENWSLALPEIFLGASSMGLLLVGAYAGEKSTRAISWATVAALMATLALVVWGERGFAFSDLFVANGFTQAMKALSLIGSALAIVMARETLERDGCWRFEFPLLVALATLGMMLMLSANDLMALYLGLEMQSLALYVVASFQRDSLRSTEAGLKYFVLGAVASGMLLYGSSLLYGFAGSTSYSVLADTFRAMGAPSLGAVVGLVFVIAGLAFKVSAVPFHMWTPDVYEGAPTPVTALFAVAPKVAAMGLIVGVLIGPLAALVDQWRQIVVFVAVASCVVGGFAAIAQTNIKRLMAYSSIGHMGYVLLGVAAGTEVGVQSVIVYMTIYLFMSVGTFAIILSMRRDGKAVEEIADLAGLASTHKLTALALTVFMFSMAGIPPLAGFFGKLAVFMAAIEAGIFVPSVIAVLSSVVGAFYYLRIIKLAWMDPATKPLDRGVGGEMAAVMTVATVAIVAFIVLPGPLLNGAKAAAQALFPN